MGGQGGRGQGGRSRVEVEARAGLEVNRRRSKARQGPNLMRMFLEEEEEELHRSPSRPAVRASQGMP